jgi:hypothetical protein
MHRFARLALCAAVLTTFASYNAMAAQAIAPDPEDGDLVPTGKGWGERANPPGSNGNGYGQGNGQFGVGSNGIFYHGGPVMLGTTNVYYIWYGNWSGNTAPTILNNLMNSMGGSAYYNINTTYYDGAGNHVANSIAFKGTANDNYSQGSALSDASIKSIVTSAINAGLPKETNAVYFVLTSADVNETSGFCTQYCGWHTHGTIGGSDIKYAFIGNPARCPSACAAQTTSPNNNLGADGMASIISHELEESTSDPDLNAWYDRRGQENADKCAWTFGTESTASNGSKYNQVMGGMQYLIQRNWVNTAGGYCATSY